MTYDDIAKKAESLAYRDKLRLAQLLIQLARKEEEEQNPHERALGSTTATEHDILEYVVARLRKLKAGKKETVLNSIGAMFQFQGGISDQDKERLFADLVAKRLIKLSENGRVEYPGVA